MEKLIENELNEFAEMAEKMGVKIDPEAQKVCEHEFVSQTRGVLITSICPKCAKIEVAPIPGQGLIYNVHSLP
jgi:predicted Zn-ribbon and HTH transcriptional regulator